MIESKKTQCKICGNTFTYYSDYEPATCNNFDCVYKWLHPEIRKNKKEVEVLQNNKSNIKMSLK